jgi:hypothetical protein
MSKYGKLTEYLSQLDGDAFMTNFAALEKILGFELPPSARQYAAWWANQGKGQSLAWETAGWKTSEVSPSIQTVRFVRSKERVTRDINQVAKLTIAQAKAGLAANFGVSVDSIDITIRG